MSTSVNDQLKALPGMSREDLQTLWSMLFDKPASSALRRENLIPVLAYRLQERALGGLKASGAKRLRMIVQDEATGRGTSALSPVRVSCASGRESCTKSPPLPRATNITDQKWRSLSGCDRQ